MSSEVQPQPQELKFSRYRSVRKAAAQKTTPSLSSPSSPPPLPRVNEAPTSPPNEAIARSRSRYRKTRPTAPPANGQVPLPTTPEQGQPLSQVSSRRDLRQPYPPPAQEPDAQISIPRRRTTSAPRVPTHRASHEKFQRPHTSRQYDSASFPVLPGERVGTEDVALMEAKNILQNEARRQKKLRDDARRLAAEKAERKEEELETVRREAEAEEAQRQREIEKERQECEASERLLNAEKERKRELKKQRAEAKRAEHAQKKAEHAERKRRDEFESQNKQEALANPPLSPLRSSPQRGRLGFLSRLKTDDMGASEPIEHFESRSPEQDRTQVPSKIETPTGGVVPRIDAPVSAVNAGERRVSINCNGTSILLPITPETTPTDLIYSAANVSSQYINPKTSVLLESFDQLGLQRPIRKYEHIRDIMNSWDSDTQNCLILAPSATNGADRDLEAVTVPQQQPGETSAYLHYSQRPGKWDKRWITLRSDGQVVVAKKENGKDATNICHLSDFDIYAPTPHQLSKKLRSPKKLCFAVKSQQKSSMFLSTANFVHFFATGDKALAAAWYKAVQEWRSWYLVNVMGEGSMAKTNAGITSAQRPDSRGGQHVAESNTPYQIGTFKPLLDLDEIFSHGVGDEPSGGASSRDDAPRSYDTKAFPGRKASVRDREGRNAALPGRNLFTATNDPSTSATNVKHHTHNPSLIQGVSPQEMTDATFAPTGLLGRTYSQRQKTLHEREMAQASNSGPFTLGPNLLNGELETPPPSSAAAAAAAAGGGALRMRPSTDEAGDSPSSFLGMGGLGLGRTTSTSHQTSSSKSHSPGPHQNLHHTPSSSRYHQSQNQNQNHAPHSLQPKPKPLVDLTPEYRAPPQHARKGQGRGFSPHEVIPPGAPLIEAATSSFETAGAGAGSGSGGEGTGAGAGTGIKASGALAGIGGMLKRAGTTTTRSTRHPSSHPSHAFPPSSANDASTKASAEPGAEAEFTGLLARSLTNNAQNARRGQGDRAGPMVDLSEPSTFAPGSLLAGVEDRDVSATAHGGRGLRRAG
ncbi:MAG: hypothetical protein M1819_006888 [Sarea resinae]|nr:MAG: hypothetical protein M1819_006888 [Sarea resinae]